METTAGYVEEKEQQSSHFSIRVNAVGASDLSTKTA
jgi:hypothetical protein